ncbi:MAG: SUMF1/EgtB/PvdO family nonheme iron enzyme [Candidatus Lernaella stagnicola]|nr:SUMF1/EgtB/PvdO family nonheme iron enzyme [Candidatus Lernaella stagnicola]
MKRFFTWLLPLLVLTTVSLAGDAPRVAVLDFQNPAGLEQQEVDYITELVRTEARKMLPRDRYVLMTKENIQDLLPPERRNLSECVGECEVETGRMIGARYLATGEIVRFGGELRVTVRLYDVETGNLLESRRAKGKKTLDLEAPLERVSSMLFVMLPGANQFVATAPEPVVTPTPKPYTPPANADPAFEKLVREEQVRIEAERRLAAERQAQRDADYLAVKAIHDSPSYSDEAKKAAYAKFIEKWAGDTARTPEVKKWLASVDVPEGMVHIPAGWFQMGCSSGDSECDNDEKPSKRVYVEGFFMDAHEVTQAEYQRVTGTNPSHFPGCPTCPVEMVSWHDARNYCAKVGKSLPTEAEWEYAARGGTTGVRYGNLDSIAWYSKNSGLKIHPVGQKQPNAYGLFDMLGNVWEWCEDGYDENWYSRMPERNPKNESQSQFRVLRGGCWINLPLNVRASYRYRFLPTITDSNFGFRCVGTEK